LANGNLTAQFDSQAAVKSLGTIAQTVYYPTVEAKLSSGNFVRGKTQITMSDVASTVSVSSAPNPSTYGQSVTFTAIAKEPATVGVQLKLAAVDAQPVGSPDHAHAYPPEPPLADVMKRTGSPTNTLVGLATGGATDGSVYTVNDSAPDVTEYPFESVATTEIEAPTTAAVGAQATDAVVPEQPAGSPYQSYAYPPAPPAADTEKVTP
jgi:hypothetical protein